MTDIVERLRRHDTVYAGGNTILTEAANEIERLRKDKWVKPKLLEYRTRINILTDTAGTTAHRDRESDVVERVARAMAEAFHAPCSRTDDMARAAIRETLMDMHDNFRPQPFSSWDDAVRHYAMRLSISLSPQEDKQ